jgi:hypothetical protein
MSLLSHKNPFGFPAEEVGFVGDLTPPADEQYILRMMVRTPSSGGFKVPQELQWLLPLIETCNKNQVENRIFNPFVYITVRHGIVKSVTDDMWHVDGFSMRTPHIPEQNYIYASKCGTEELVQDVKLPVDFDPMRHNIHQYFEDVADVKNIRSLKDKTLYRIDPYVIHRRPTVTSGMSRTFFRISFIPIEIEDDTCTVNPLIPRLSPYGRGDIRNQLQRYVIPDIYHVGNI